MAINQYKDGKSINDYKKGNRTKSKRETEQIVRAVKQYSDNVEYYKELAEKLRQGKKHRQEEVYTVYRRITEYIEKQQAEEKPLTVSGLIRCSGLSKSSWYELAKGSGDYHLYQLIDAYNIDIDNTDYIDGIPVTTITQDGKEVVVMLIAWAELIEKAMLCLEEETESRLYSKGRVGDIFSLKAVHGWQEESGPSTVHQNLTLNIASVESAREAIRLLK